MELKLFVLKCANGSGMQYLVVEANLDAAKGLLKKGMFNNRKVDLVEVKSFLAPKGITEPCYIGAFKP